jgi:3'(2'), 5'-bisphosphate nucleotidase
MVAEGRADLYPRLGSTKEWHTATGHAIVSAAGGRVTLLDGTPLL